MIAAFVTGASVLTIAALFIHLASIALVLPRFRTPATGPANHPAITILRPVCGLDPGLGQTLGSTFTDMPAEYEVVFCLASPSDPAISVIRAVMAGHPAVPSRLLIGDDQISGNPKLNNLAKGWAAARHDHVAMIDSNVLLPRDYIATLFAHKTPGTGLVTSPPAGTEPAGLWASVEAGFLNTYQDRWQLVSDQLGHGFAQGKVLMWQKSVLDCAGGLAALGHDLAEDVGATKVARAAGLKVRVVSQPFAQPLGHRTASEVWQRQVRWARVRRAGFPVLYAAEILSAAVLPFAILAGLTVLRVVPAPAAIAYPVLWYGAEFVLARRAGWPSQPRDLCAWLLRDALIPAVWLVAFASRGFVWRGTDMHQDDPRPHLAR